MQPWLCEHRYTHYHPPHASTFACKLIKVILNVFKIRPILYLKFKYNIFPRIIKFIVINTLNIYIQFKYQIYLSLINLHACACTHAYTWKLQIQIINSLKFNAHIDYFSSLSFSPIDTYYRNIFSFCHKIHNTKFQNMFSPKFTIVLPLFYFTTLLKIQFFIF